MRQVVRACSVLVVAFSAIADAQTVGVPGPEPLRLVRERGRESDVFQGPDRLLRLSGPETCLRTRQIFSDFTLSVEFQLETVGSQGGIGLRTLHTGGSWPAAGYRLVLAPGTRPELRAPDKPVKPASASETATMLMAGDWHELTITANGRTLTLVLDGARIGVYEVDILAGAVFVESGKGPVVFRSLTVSPIPPADVVKASDHKHNKGFQNPRLEKEARPNYTARAMERGAEGLVMLEAVVETDGTVGPVTVTQFLDPDLEHAALAAIRRWRFKPALLDGKPVRALVEVEMSFTLKR
jgi:TonB family protein